MSIHTLKTKREQHWGVFLSVCCCRDTPKHKREKLRQLSGVRFCVITSETAKRGVQRQQHTITRARQKRYAVDVPSAGRAIIPNYRVSSPSVVKLYDSSACVELPLSFFRDRQWSRRFNGRHSPPRSQQQRGISSNHLYVAVICASEPSIKDCTERTGRGGWGEGVTWLK